MIEYTQRTKGHLPWFTILRSLRPANKAERIQHKIHPNLGHFPCVLGQLSQNKLQKPKQQARDNREKYHFGLTN